MSSAYVPLWCKSNYSFLEGASHPDELVEQAARLGIPAIGVTDRDGVYGIVQAHQAAKEHGLKLIIGSEVTVTLNPGVWQSGAPTWVPPARSASPLARGASSSAGGASTVDAYSVVLLAQDREGYANLCGLISTGRRRSPKGESSVTTQEVCEHADGVIALWTGRRRGDTAYTASPASSSPSASHGAPGSTYLPEVIEETALADLAAAFDDRLYLSISRHQQTGDAIREARVNDLCVRFNLPAVALPEVLYHVPERRRLADVVTCIRHVVTLNEAGALLAPNGGHALQSNEEMQQLFADSPELLVRTVEIAESCHFALDEIDYRYPSEKVPNGYTTSEWLWELTFAGARKRYGGSIPADVRSQLQKELSLIDELDYAGYFLTMWEIIEYCRRQSIICQGRGSAANSAVCYCLGITAVDPVRMDLLFERFLSRERAEPPDIDLDIEHRRREEVIQHMYRKYGRERAAMVANVIRYRVKSALRDVGKVLEFPATALDRMAKLASSRDSNMDEVLESAGLGEEVRTLFAELVIELLDFPRHLSIHPGGFLLGSEPVHRLVPIENATMPDRTVIQWDKYDVEAMNLFKVDLLGLGALTHLDYCFQLLKSHRAIDLEMATIPHDDPAVFKMICKGDTVGVFQLESRAQMSMLPRLRPKTWYDIVIEVSIVRPGPITGGMVHPYLRRRAGEEEVIYPHPALEPVLRKTLGVPIFQEQVMKLAVVAADYTPGEADQLRRDMAAWRRSGRIEKHHDRFVQRMIAKGIASEFAEAVFSQIKGFGEYGFPESHAASFSLIAYATAWMRAHYPAEFVCGILNAWPMGFYSPASIVEDAKRHGVEMRSIDVMESDWDCTLELISGTGNGAKFAVRMGLRYVKGISEADYQRIVRARPTARTAPPGAQVSGSSRQAYTPAIENPALNQFSRRARLSEDLLVALARAGAFGCFGLDRRAALWEVSGTSLRRTAREKEAGVNSSRSHASDGRNASSPDFGTPDSGTPDFGTPDSGTPDSGTPDSGTPDSGTRDSGLRELLAADEALPSFDPLSDFELVAWDYYTSSHSVQAHPLEPHRDALTAAGHPSASDVWAMEDGERTSYIGLAITRQRPGTAGGTMFVTLEDETGYVNLVVWKQVFQKYRPVLITAAVLGVEGKIQSKDGVTHLIVDHCFKPQLSMQGFRIESRDFR